MTADQARQTLKEPFDDTEPEELTITDVVNPDAHSVEVYQLIR